MKKLKRETQILALSVLALAFHTTALAEDSPLDYYVDNTIVYVAPTAHYDGDGNVTGYSNTYAEQRANYVQQVLQQADNNVATIQAQTAVERQNQQNEQKKINKLMEDINETSPGYKELVEGSLKEEADPEKAGKLGRLDKNEDGVITDAERKEALKNRVSMGTVRYGDSKLLDADGDGELSLEETSTAVDNTVSQFRGSDEEKAELTQQLAQIQATQRGLQANLKAMEAHIAQKTRPTAGGNEEATLQQAKHTLEEQGQQISTAGAAMIEATKTANGIEDEILTKKLRAQIEKREADRAASGREARRY